MDKTNPDYGDYVPTSGLHLITKDLGFSGRGVHLVSKNWPPFDDMFLVS